MISTDSDKLDLIREQTSGADSEQAKKEADSFDKERQKAYLRSYEQDTGERKKYANRIFWLMFGWLVFIVSIVIFQGFGIFNFNLDNTVFIAVISSATVNIIGIFFIIAKSLFPPSRIPEIILESGFIQNNQSEN